MKGLVIKKRPLCYVPVLEWSKRDYLKYSRLTNEWIHSTICPKTFRTRKRAEQFLKDFGY